ncbi:hypothetical protein L596_026603 [Steinernema carpocapsae]|uniref:Uncharacterized protein n=1 Tax=Steinernema carpocapsae TaxID=34508 RepID=A0A4U5M1V2_STECR|nr:hypothetical protein L596_026603 [Steinernema carpocapsae]
MFPPARSTVRTRWLSGRLSKTPYQGGSRSGSQSRRNEERFGNFEGAEFNSPVNSPTKREAGAIAARASGFRGLESVVLAGTAERRK